jgi:hypothetical protein
MIIRSGGRWLRRRSFVSATTITGARPATRSLRGFYVVLSAFITLLVFIGFWPTYFGRLIAGTAEHIPFIHFHAAIYVGWLALFTAQTLLAATGRVRLHMTLGRIGVAYGVLLVIVGVAVSLIMFSIRVRAGDSEQAQLRLLGPLVDMAVFAPLFGAAVYFRRRPGLHKRLMIVATTSLLIAAVGRMAFLGTPASAWLVSLVWVSPILLAMAYDWFEHRTVHPVYAAGAAILVAERIWRSGARESETWAAVCAWLATLVG